jgi:hypothetical protein
VIFGGRDPNEKRLLLDARGVEVPMASTPNVVLLSSLKPFFVNSLKRRWASRTTLGPNTPESNKSVSSSLSESRYGREEPVVVSWDHRNPPVHIISKGL